MNYALCQLLHHDGGAFLMRTACMLTMNRQQLFVSLSGRQRAAPAALTVGAKLLAAAVAAASGAAVALLRCRLLWPGCC